VRDPPNFVSDDRANVATADREVGGDVFEKFAKCAAPPHLLGIGERNPRCVVRRFGSRHHGKCSLLPLREKADLLLEDLGASPAHRHLPIHAPRGLAPGTGLNRSHRGLDAEGEQETLNVTGKLFVLGDQGWRRRPAIAHRAIGLEQRGEELSDDIAW
jgi:hypothetical protein